MGKDNWLVMITTVLTTMVVVILFIPLWVLTSVLNGIHIGLSGGLIIVKDVFNSILEDS